MNNETINIGNSLKDLKKITSLNEVSSSFTIDEKQKERNGMKKRKKRRKTKCDPYKITTDLTHTHTHTMTTHKNNKINYKNAFSSVLHYTKSKANKEKKHQTSHNTQKVNN